MIVRYLKRAAIVLLVLIAALALGRLYQVATESLYAGERKPYLQVLTTDSVTIRWQTEDDETGVVRYGLSPDRLDQLAVEQDAGEHHELRLSGLEADSRYFYSAGNRAQATYSGDEYYFTTAPQRGSTDPIRLWIIGDPGKAGPDAVNVRDSVLEWVGTHPLGNTTKIDLLIGLGDLAYTSGANIDYQQALFDIYEAVLANTPFLAVYGNHDARRWAYFNIFTLPENGEAGGVASGTEHYYSIDYGNAHVVVLDSQASDRGIESDMYSWLQKDLQANERIWLIAAFHHPPYTKGTHNSDSRRDSRGRMQDMRENFLPLLEAHGVDLVFSGHSHMYERSFLIDCHYGYSDTLDPTAIIDRGSGDPAMNAPYRKAADPRSHQGAVYVVTGSASKLDQAPIDHPVMGHSLLELGSVVVDIEGLRLDARFINDKGEVRDHFRIEKSDDSKTRDPSACDQQSG